MPDIHYVVRRMSDDAWTFFVGGSVWSVELDHAKKMDSASAERVAREWNERHVRQARGRNKAQAVHERRAKVEIQKRAQRDNQGDQL